MSFLDSILGYSSINKQRKQADEYARSAYDPNIYNPQVNQARRQAIEGIADEQIREDVVGQIYRSEPRQQMAMYGGNQAQAVAGSQRTQAQRTSQLAGAETQIGLREAQAKQMGRQQLAQAQTQARQTQAQQESALSQNKMMAEAEKQRRRDALIGGLADFGLSAVGGSEVIGDFIGEQAGNVWGNIQEQFGFNTPEMFEDFDLSMPEGFGEMTGAVQTAMNTPSIFPDQQPIQQQPTTSQPTQQPTTPQVTKEDVIGSTFDVGQYEQRDNTQEQQQFNQQFGLGSVIDQEIEPMSFEDFRKENQYSVADNLFDIPKERAGAGNFDTPESILLGAFGEPLDYITPLFGRDVQYETTDDELMNRYLQYKSQFLGDRPAGFLRNKNTNSNSTNSRWDNNFKSL